MKEIRVGVVGCGAIGREHIARLTNIIHGASVVAVADYYKPAAEEMAKKYGVKCCENGNELIALPEVGAVLITSADPSHAGYVLEGIKHNKFVFCEKPLAQTAADCEAIMKAEIAAGRRLVQVGFMRRYDRGYVAMKQAIDAGEIGTPLMIHSCHRMLSQAPGFETDYAITRVAIHEIDMSRWLLGDEYAGAQVFQVRQSSRTTGDWLNPQLMMLRTKSDQRIIVETQTDGAYAYDIQCEVVGEDGTVNLPDPAAVVKRTGARCEFPLMTDWAQRFVEAYDIEFAAWVNSLLNNGAPDGPSSWDGYVSCVTADALIRSRQTGKEEAVELMEKPELYK